TNSGTGPTVSHSYFDVGPKLITLTLTHNGCPTVATTSISIHPPIVSFKYQPDCGANKFQVLFTDTSYLYPPLTQYTATWNFGDGSPVQTAPAGGTITHIYTPADPTILSFYNVSLTTSDGTCTQSLTKTITLGPIPFTFISPSQQCSGSPIHLTATSPSPDASHITGYYWHWDNDPDITYNFSPSPSADMISTTRGNRTLTLVIQLSNGCLDSLSHNVLITYPDALFTTPAGACRNGTVQFTDQSSIDPATNSPLKAWSWNFGDGTTPSTTQNPTHTYADTGLFTPQLFVQDVNNCSRTYISSTPIHITSPIANFGGPDSFYCPKTPLIFKDSSIGFNLTDSWNYGDGNTDNTGTHSFDNNQTYNVTLTVTDQFTCTSSITKPVRIQAPIPAFDISDTTAICIPLQTKFVAHGQYYESLYWDFGDGSTSTLPNTSHFYNSTGIFNATLFLQGPGGCLESATRKVFLLDPVAASKFNYGPLLSKCDSVPVQFDLAPPGFTHFTLVFGDGAADSSQNATPFHMYRSPGSYTPTLVLVDPTGCIVNVGTAIGPVTVLGSIPFVSLDPHAFCDSSIVTFTDYTITNDGIVSETLNFGDGTPPETHNTGVADFNTDHLYNKPGTFLANLHVVTNSTCAEDYTDTVRVHQTPHPLISEASPLCTGLIQFNGNTTVPQLEPVSWAWDFGNGQTSKDQNPSTDFKPGPYTVRLQTAVPFGCTDTISQAITVNPPPEIKGPREISTPVGLPITIPFTYSENVNTWAWTPIENLDCNTCPNPVATLIFKKEYHVTVTDANNCMSSDSILIITICNDKNYFIPNTFSPNGDGVNDYFYPRGSNLYNIQSLRVFNRWGQVVFERKNFPANDATMGWDGNFNGRPAPVDAYVYIAEVICNNAQVVALHGDVTLVR
ncbi:MAG TPA: PKD domain-containing protein, partial [Puia sp.]|nr:PKD domain-containing protein [Puia sp.]